MILLAYPAHFTSTVDVARGWERALSEVGHDVWRFDYAARLLFYQEALSGWKGRNPSFAFTEEDKRYLASRAGVADVVESGCDLVLVVDGLSLHPAFYRGVRKLGLPLALLLTECPYLDKEINEMCMAVEPDAVFVNDLNSVGKFPNAEYLPQSCDPAVHYGDPGAERPVDVAFVGTLYPERKPFIMQEWGAIHYTFVAPEMQPEGQRWGNDKVAGLYRRSKIVVNLNRTVRYAGRPDHLGDGEAWSIGARAYESAACGALSLSEEGRGELTRVFGESAVTFRTPQELREQVRHFLSADEERLRLAREQQDAVRNCTFSSRAKRTVNPRLLRMMEGQ